MCPGFRAADLFDPWRWRHRSGVGVLVEGGFVAAGPRRCDVEDAGLFDVPAAVAVGVSSSVSEWFPSPGITPMTHLQVDPPSYLNTPPPGGTLPRGVSTSMAAPLKRLRGDRSCRLGHAPRENSPEVHHSGPTRPATPETPNPLADQHSEALGASQSEAPAASVAVWRGGVLADSPELVRSGSKRAVDALRGRRGWARRTPP